MKLRLKDIAVVSTALGLAAAAMSQQYEYTTTVFDKPGQDIRHVKLLLNDPHHVLIEGINKQNKVIQYLGSVADGSMVQVSNASRAIYCVSADGVYGGSVKKNGLSFPAIWENGLDAKPTLLGNGRILFGMVTNISNQNIAYTLEVDNVFEGSVSRAIKISTKLPVLDLQGDFDDVAERGFSIYAAGSIYGNHSVFDVSSPKSPFEYQLLNNNSPDGVVPTAVNSNGVTGGYIATPDGQGSTKYQTRIWDLSQPNGAASSADVISPDGHSPEYSPLVINDINDRRNGREIAVATQYSVNGSENGAFVVKKDIGWGHYVAEPMDGKFAPPDTQYKLVSRRAENVGRDGTITMIGSYKHRQVGIVATPRRVGQRQP